MSRVQLRPGLAWLVLALLACAGASSLLSIGADSHGPVLIPALVPAVPVLAGGTAGSRDVPQATGSLVADADPFAARHPVAGNRVLITGVVKGISQQPILGVSIAVSGYPGAVSGTDGRYELSIPFLAFAPDLALTAVSGGYSSWAGRVRLSQAGATNIVLERRLRLHGRVIDQRGNPLAGVALRLAGRQRGRADRSVTTSLDGRFAFDDATEGTWRLAVAPPSPREDWRGPGEVELRGQEEAHQIELFRLSPGRNELLLEVVDASTGRGLHPASVLLHRADRLRAPGEPIHIARVVAGPGGQVRAKGLRSGLWKLRIRLEDGRMVCRRFSLCEGERRIRMRVEVGRPGVLTGEIVLPPDACLCNGDEVSIDLVDCPGARFMTGEASVGVAGGHGCLPSRPTIRFRFENVPSHTTVRVVVAAGSRVSSRDVYLRSGGGAHVRLAPVEGGVLELRGNRPSLAGIATISWRLERSAWSPEETVKPSARGAVLARCRTPPGAVRWRFRYRASAGRLDLQTLEGTVDVQPGRTSIVMVDLFDHRGR